MVAGPDSNLSFVLKAVKDVALEEKPLPEIKSDFDVICHIEQTGICGSDVHYWQRGRIGPYQLTAPMVLGHESSGTIVQVGDKVTDLKPGDKVAIEPGVPCRRCNFCRSGSYYLCPGMVFAATPPYDGTLATYYTCASDFCYKLPDNMDLEEGAMVEPVSVACAINMAGEVRGGSTVLVLGAGPIGVLCSAVAKAWGARRVVTVDVVPSRLEVAQKYGADTTFMPSKQPPGTDALAAAEATAKELCSATGLGDGADIVLECSGAEPCVQFGVFACRDGGTMVQAGMGKKLISFPITAICTKGLSLKGSIRYRAGCYPAAVNLISSGKIPVKPLITNRFPFLKAEEAFQLVKAGKSDVFKVMIEGVKTGAKLNGTSPINMNS